MSAEEIAKFVRDFIDEHVDQVPDKSLELLQSWVNDALREKELFYQVSLGMDGFDLIPYSLPNQDIGLLDTGSNTEVGTVEIDGGGRGIGLYSPFGGGSTMGKLVIKNVSWGIVVGGHSGVFNPDED